MNAWVRPEAAVERRDGFIRAKHDHGLGAVEPGIREGLGQIDARGKVRRQDRAERRQFRQQPARGQLAEVVRPDEQPAQEALQAGVRRVAADDVQEGGPARGAGEVAVRAVRLEAVEDRGVPQFGADQRQQASRADVAEQIPERRGGSREMRGGFGRGGHGAGR